MITKKLLTKGEVFLENVELSKFYLSFPLTKAIDVPTPAPVIIEIRISIAIFS
jgi:hypothetical protein